MIGPEMLLATHCSRFWLDLAVEQERKRAAFLESLREQEARGMGRLRRALLGQRAKEGKRDTG